MNDLSKLEIFRMVRWLLELEPNQLWLHEIQPHFWALREKGRADVIVHSNDYVSQDRLFGVCYRAALARDWNFQLSTNEFCSDCNSDLDISIGRPVDDDPSQVSEYSPLQYGYSAADALIKAHGVEDWRTRDPE